MSNQRALNGSHTIAWRCLAFAAASAIALGAWSPRAALADPCVVQDNTTGTITLPPEGCEYLSPEEVHLIIDGLPPATTIELAPIHRDFICNRSDGFPGCPPPGVCEDPTLGTDCFESVLLMELNGTGDLADFQRSLTVPMFCQVVTGPRNPGDAVQTFSTEMQLCQGAIFGDPDFDFLQISAGQGAQLPPSIGQTTLTRLGPPGSDFQVDSFFDIVYRIDYQGTTQNPASPLIGLQGSTTATIRMEAFGPPPTFCPLATNFCQNFAADCVGTSGELCHVSRVIGTATGGPQVDGCECAFDIDCGPINVQTDPATGQIAQLDCLPGNCPQPNDRCEIYINGNSTGGPSIPASAIQPGTVITCDCPKPAPDPHRTTPGTSITFGQGDTPPIPADFFGPGSDPFLGSIPLQGTGELDTVIQRARGLEFPPLPLPQSDTVEIQIVALSLVSSQPITVTSGGLNPQEWDVAIGLAPGPQVSGEVRVTKTHSNGGVFDAEVPLLPVYTFTQVGAPLNVREIDQNDTGLGPIRVNFVGIPWVAQLNPALAGQVAAPNNGEWVPGVLEQTPGDPNSQVIASTFGNSKGGGVGHPIQPVELCRLNDEGTGLPDPCQALQTRDCVGSPNDSCLPRVVQVNAAGGADAVECDCYTPSPTVECGPVFIDPSNGVISCSGLCPAGTNPPCQLWEVRADGTSVPTGQTQVPADVFPPGTTLFCDCAPPTFPPAGTDLSPSVGVLTVDVPSLGPLNVNVSGEVLLEWQDPQTDPGTGERTVQTEMLSLSLAGSNPSLGPITVVAGSQNGLPPTLGDVNPKTPGSDFPALASFDVFFEVDVQGVRLRNSQPLVMQANIDEIPPRSVGLQNQGPVQLVDPQNPDTTATLTLGFHWMCPPPFPPPGQPCPVPCNQNPAPVCEFGDCPPGTKCVTDPVTNRCECLPSPIPCCLPDGSCAILDINECRAGHGKQVTACLGDADGNGLDDACQNEKCDNCAPGPHWVDACPPLSPDSDTINTGALLGIDLNGDCVADTSLRMSGITTIGKRGPLDDSVNIPGTRPVDGHKDVVDTEIIWASMNGGGVTLDIGTALGLNPTLGNVAELPFDPLTGRSRFDVLARLSGGPLANPVYNWDPITVLEDVTCLPPNGRYIHFSGCTPLYPDPKPVVGVLPVAWLVRAIHFTFPDCCLPDGPNGKLCSCTSTLTPAQCEALGGVPSNCAGDSNNDGCDDACNPPVDLCPDPSPQQWCGAFPADCVPDASDLQFCLPTGFVTDAAGPRATGCDCFREGPECGPVNVRDGIAPDGTPAQYYECKGVCDDGTPDCFIHIDGVNTGLFVMPVLDAPPGAAVTCDCPPVGACQPNAARDGCEPFVCPNANETCKPTKIKYIGVCQGTLNSCQTDADCPQPDTCNLRREVVECDCVPDDPPPATCHWQDNPLTGAAECVGLCDDGVTACHVVSETIGGLVQFRCTCDEPSECRPNATGTACEPFTCPGPLPPLDTCVATCVDVNPLTGQVTITACDCRGSNECRARGAGVSGGSSARGVGGGGGTPCVLPENIDGSVTLPPAGCDYLSPDEFHELLDGVPAGVTIEIAAIHKDFACIRQPGADPGFCPPGLPDPIFGCEAEGGDLGGNVECGESKIEMTVLVNGASAGRAQPHFMTLDGTHLFHSGPHGGGADVQSFDTEMVALQAEAPPDVLFSLLRVRAGRQFGLPSPGHTTLTRLPSGDFTVDSFFDVTYEIEYVGAPGSVLEGTGGTTTGTIRMKTGAVPECEGACPDDPLTQCVETVTVNADGTISKCCDCGCPPSSRPRPVPIEDVQGNVHDLTSNRFLMFEAGDPGRNQAIRVTFEDLRPPYDLWNGRQMYVGNPGLVGNAGGSPTPTGGPRDFFAARLQCDPVCRDDWSTFGALHVFHEWIIPGSKYSVDVVECKCDINDKGNYSPALTLTTSVLGDILEDLSITPPGPPDGERNVVDALGVLRAFASAPTAPRKARADIEPNCLDLRINVTDALQTLRGFGGGVYDFPPKASDPCLSPCSNPIPSSGQ